MTVPTSEWELLRSLGGNSEVCSQENRLGNTPNFLILGRHPKRMVYV